MAISNLVLTVGGVLGSILFDKIRAHRAKNALPDPPPFGTAQLDKFTHVRNGLRVFDHDMAVWLDRNLATRSAVQVHDRRISRLGEAWRLVPLQEGLPNASEIVRHARGHGKVVLGSFTLGLLPVGVNVPMLVFIGGPSCVGLAAEGANFAHLPAPEIAVAAEQAPTEPPTAPLDSIHSVNGAAKSAATNPDYPADTPEKEP